MDDVRWFAPNRFCTLVVPRLRDRGLSIALDGDRPARLAIAMDAQVAADACRYAVRHRCPLIHYVWDLPPWWLGRGRYDWVWLVAGRYVWLPRLGRRYAARRGFYSRLRYVAAHAAAVWVPSAATARDVRSRFGVECRQVPFCFDSDRFTPAPAARTGLLSVSRLTRPKNHAAVIRAAARFEPALAVRIVGDGPERDGLARLARELRVPCTIESALSEAEMVTAYRSARRPRRGHGAGADGVCGAVTDEPTVDRGPFLIGAGDNRFPFCVQHEHTRRRLHEARAAADAAFALHAHADRPARIHAAVAQ